MNDSIKIKGSWEIKVFEKDGTLKQSAYGSNLITNVGKAAIAGLVGNVGAITAFSYVAVGTSSTAVAVTDTTLGAETVTSGLSRAASTVSRTTTGVTNDTIQFQITFTASGSVSVQEMGIFNAASTGTLLGHALTGTISVVSTNLLQITYSVQFS